MDLTTSLIIIFLFVAIQIWILRRIFRINQIIEKQDNLINLLCGIALKMGVDEHFFPKVKQYDQPQVHPIREMFGK